MKTAIVTGATGNMGKAVVSTLLANGWRVIGTAGRQEDLDAVAVGDRFILKKVDLLSETECTGFVSSVIEEWGVIDAAILTVGGFAMGDITATGANDIAKQIDLNFMTTYQVARPVFSHMLEKSYGRIFLAGARPGLNA